MMWSGSWPCWVRIAGKTPYAHHEEENTYLTLNGNKMETTIRFSSGSSDRARVNRGLLLCGILSSLLYVAMNVLIPMQFEGYSVVSQTVSELSAIGASSF